MASVRLACHAMATRFELLLHGDNPVSLRASGEEAIATIHQLEDRLSLFRPQSEIARLNALAARAPVQVTASLFSLLQHARDLHQASGGAFDITIAPLVRCWGFMGGSGRVPTSQEVEEARGKVGMNLVQFDEADRTVRFTREGVMLDLGAIGKGYAIEQTAEMLREAGVQSALLHGGTSTVCALGRPPDAEFWTVAIEYPENSSLRTTEPQNLLTPTLSPSEGEREKPSGERARHGVLPLPLCGVEGLGEGAAASKDLQSSSAADQPLRINVSITNESLSVSAIHGKFFQADGATYGHVLDPRSGRPVTRAALAAVSLPSATETDALSTALLTLGPDAIEKIAALRPGIRALVVWEADGRILSRARGLENDE